MKKNGIIKIVLLAAILLLLLNPAIIPFFDASTKAAISSQLRSNFGALAGSNSASVLSWPNIITALVVIILMWLVATVICRILQKTCMKGGRKETVGGLMMSITKYAAVLITVVWVLGIFGVNLAGIFASLGILSLIVGFGAQSLIEDTITGIFIIFEGHYNVGDIIILDDFRGEVKKIGVRTTVIEDTGHNLKIVNNSDIRNIQNRSKNLSLAVCDVGTSYDADIRKLEEIIIPALPAMYENNKDVFSAAPQYKGVQELGDSAVVLRITVDCNESNYFVAKRRLNREIKILFDEKGVEIPFNQVVVHPGK